MGGHFTPDPLYSGSLDPDMTQAAEFNRNLSSGVKALDYVRAMFFGQANTRAEPILCEYCVEA